ncbi:MAG: AMP-binding protein [Fodinibius sp.]|nr:AMP-binding protein [Fodinibius sp.]
MNASESLLLCGPPAVEPSDGPSEYEIQERALGLFTSATTGAPKCIWNTYNRLVHNARITGREFDLSQRDRLLMMAKPWHVAGLSWVLMAEQRNLNYSFIHTKKGEIERWYRAIKEYRPTYLLTVPTVLRKLFTYEDWQVPNIVFGGAPITSADYGPLAEHCSTIYQGYGQTEAGGLISCKKLSADAEIPKEMVSNYGSPPDEFELRCRGSKEKPASIWLKSPTAIYGDFYDTGDCGYRADDGSLVLKGRAKIEDQN